jgi:hypothetical protein
VVRGAPSQRDTEFLFESLVVLRSIPDHKIVVQKRQHSS